MAGKFEIYKDNAGEFRFRLKAGNGQNLLASEGYKAHKSCVAGVESVKNNAPTAARFEKLETKAGKHAFNLKAANHQVIGVSQAYATAAARDAGISAVQVASLGAATDDLTTA